MDYPFGAFRMRLCFRVDIKRSVYFPPSATDGDAVLQKNGMKIVSRYNTPLIIGMTVGRLDGS